jgi:1-acyl-sn-glycerol-3-phosphate acyltransferase
VYNRQAIFEFSGAILAGGEVTSTIRKGIVDPATFTDSPELLVFGMLASLLAAGIWLLIASKKGWPVSTTHSIVGAVVGFAAVGIGMDAVHWSKVGTIVMSWVVSPLTSGIIAFLIFQSVHILILRTDDPLKMAKRYVPFYIFLTAFFMTLVTIKKGLKHVSDIQISSSESYIYAAIIVVVVAVIGAIFISNIQPDKAKEKEFTFHTVEKVFAVLMVITASGLAFAHGSNDVANAVGPLAAVVSTAQSGIIGSKAALNPWILLVGGIGIVIGSIIVARLSQFYINIGLAGIGATIVTAIVFIVPFVHSMLMIAFLFTLFGVFAAFILVPLNSKIQYLASRVHLGTILAANNFIQNIFMFSFLCITTVFAYFGMNAELLFYFMSVVGIYMIQKLYKRYSVDMFWSLMQLCSIPRHKYVYKGLENIPQDKAVLLLGNHVSWLDWILLQLPLSRKVNYMMDKDIYNWKFFHPIFKKGEAIPLSSKAFKDAFKEAHKRLKNGSIVGIFPEGEITQDGELHEFYRGYELIGKDYNGVIVPVYIDKGIFGSSFAKHKPKKSKRNIFKRRVVTIYFGKVLPMDTKAKELREIILKMREENEAK